MECFGITCFDPVAEEAEELVAAPASNNKKKPASKKKRRSVKFTPTPPKPRSSRKVILAPPPPPRPTCSLPPPTDVAWGPLVDMMPLTPDRELAFFELLHSHPSHALLAPSGAGGSTILMFAAEYHAHLAGKMILAHCVRYGQRYELFTKRNDAGRNAACYVHELDPELPVMKLFEDEMRKGGIDRDAPIAKPETPKKGKRKAPARGVRPGLLTQQSVRFEKINMRS